MAIIIFSFIFSFSFFGSTDPYAFATSQSPTTNQSSVLGKEQRFLSSPKEETLATTTSAMVFAGKGMEGDNVQISLYLKKGEDYELQKEISFKIESLGLFLKEIELLPGDNQVEVTLSRKGSQATEIRNIKYNPKNNINMESLIKNLDIKKMPNSR